MNKHCPQCGSGGYEHGMPCPACTFLHIPISESRNVETRKLRSGRQALLDLIAMREPKTPKAVQERLVDLYELRRGWTW